MTLLELVWAKMNPLEHWDNLTYTSETLPLMKRYPDTNV